MPRGKYVNHKGRSRHFTSPDELERERKKELDKKWRKKKDEDDDEESSEEEEAGPETGDGAAGPSVKKSESASGSEESESESEDDENKKKKGVEGLIEIENPNRIVKKVKKPTAKVEDDGPKEGPTPNRASTSSVKPELSRREREELEKQRARAHYQKLHAEGKTEEARADLARLALIRKQREEAAKKREDEKKAKDAATAAKHEQVNKALGKKS